MSKRNPEATCETCPYWYGDSISLCRRRETYHDKWSKDWCGEHPDFFLEEEEEDTSAFRCKPKPGETMEEFKDHVWRVKEYLRKLP